MPTPDLFFRTPTVLIQVGMALTQRFTKGRIMPLDRSHLFPMERPLVTAAAIETALLNLDT